MIITIHRIMLPAHDWPPLMDRLVWALPQVGLDYLVTNFDDLLTDADQSLFGYMYNRCH